MSSVKCEVWSVKEAVGSEKCEVWTVKCEVWSVKCGVWSFKFGVRRVQCEVHVECEDSLKKSNGCRGKDTVGTGCLWTIGHLLFGKLPPPACLGLCYSGMIGECLFLSFPFPSLVISQFCIAPQCWQISAIVSICRDESLNHVWSPNLFRSPEIRCSYFRSFPKILRCFWAVGTGNASVLTACTWWLNVGNSSWIRYREFATFMHV